MDIFTGEYKVLYSGTFHAIAAEKTSFIIADLIIKFVFEDREGEKPEVKTSSDGKTATFTFINFYDALGAGNVSPVKLGTLDNKELYFSYRISALEKRDLRSFEYTIYEKNA